MRYKLYREQQLNCDIDAAWAFFSTPKNLAKITSEEMGFEIVTQNLDLSIVEGMIIDYKISPIKLLKLKWRTRISQVDFNKSFTDFQEKGPYKYWNHHHEFISNDMGILMKDTVEYEMPYSILGSFVHKFFVKNKLKNIFDYRAQIINQLFNK